MKYIIRQIVGTIFVFYFTFCASITALGIFQDESQTFLFVLFLIGTAAMCFFIFLWAMERPFRKDYILCAAVWVKDGRTYRFSPSNIDTGYVIMGRRHDDCIKTISYLDRAEDYKNYPIFQGFITKRGKYVGREHAANIAYKADQIQKRKRTLFSEDLY